MSDLPIPAAALAKAVDIAHEALSREEPGSPWGDARICVEAAAPHIARAARIDELKLMVGNCIGVGPWESETAVTMQTLLERIAELEERDA